MAAARFARSGRGAAGTGSGPAAIGAGARAAGTVAGTGRRPGSRRSTRLRALGRSRSSQRSTAIWSRLTAPVSTRYIRPEAKKIEKKSKVEEASCVERSVSSSTAMTEASDEFFSAEMVSLPSAGTMVRIAWGATTRRISTAGVMPSACPAITCPRSTPSTPARRISAMKGASLADRARPAAPMALSFSPISGSAS